MGALKLEAQENSLRGQLATFGLNPTEWRVSHRQADVYQFAHREDPSFRINVHVRSLATGLVRVENLTLVSL